MGRVLPDKKKRSSKAINKSFLERKRYRILIRNGKTYSCTIGFESWEVFFCWPLVPAGCGAQTQERVPQRAPNNMHREPQYTRTSFEPSHCSASHVRLCLRKIGSIFKSFNNNPCKFGSTKYNLFRHFFCPSGLSRAPENIGSLSVSHEFDPNHVHVA